MTGSERYQRAARAWHDAGVPVAHSDPEGDARAVDALRVSIREIPSRRAHSRLRRTFASLAIAAAAALAVGGAVRFRALRAPAAVPATTLRAQSTPALVIRHGSTRFSDPSMETPLEPGDEVSVAAGGHARLTLPSGALVDVAPTSRLRLADADRDETIRVIHGNVALRVPKLAYPHTLSVVAPDASIFVHGTRFSVNVEGDPAPGMPRTSVRVTEGEVAVLFQTGHVVLRAGDEWHSPESAPAADKTPVVGDGAPRTANGGKSPAVASAKTAGRADIARSGDDLAVQNRLYRAALGARDRGDNDEAVSLLSELLDRYPSSPLADEARRVRARALSSLQGSGR